MTSLWSSQELDRIGRALELQIAPRRVDGTLRRSVPIWVVTVGADVYVRTWYRRPHGWFGQVLDQAGRASASRVWKSMSPSKSKAKALPGYGPASMRATAPSTRDTAVPTTW